MSILHTEFGIARLNEEGYYRISSSKEGNQGKLLHRAIYEKFWGVQLPREVHIHHKDEDKTNNCILNLEAMDGRKHNQLHMIGEKNPQYGKLKEESTMYGKSRSLDSKIQQSKDKNTSGNFRVCKAKSKTSPQGFLWKYGFYENGKRYEVTSVDINKLKEKVLNRGWEWIKLDEVCDEVTD